jgi:hypothetical protein
VSPKLYELTKEEITINDNWKYRVTTPEVELIHQYFFPSDKVEGEFMTATNVMDFLSLYTSIRITSERIGKALKYLGYERLPKKDQGSNHVKYGYYIGKREEKNDPP